MVVKIGRELLSSNIALRAREEMAESYERDAPVVRALVDANLSKSSSDDKEVV